MILLAGLICRQLQAEPSGNPSRDSKESAGRQTSAQGVFSIVKNVAYLGPGHLEKLDLYLPGGGFNDFRCPAVVWVHGWNGDKADSRERQVCSFLAGMGYVCASINYNDFGTYLEQILDGKSAVRFLRFHAKEYHVEPKRIAIGGGSYGGYVALMVGFTINDAQFEPTDPYSGTSSAVSAIVDFYGPTDYRTIPSNEVLRLRPLSTAAFAVWTHAFSPVDHLSASSPPVLIAHGKEDFSVDYHQSVELDQALSAKKVPHVFVLFDGVGHGFDLTTRKNTPLPRDLRPVVLAFLNEYLGPAPHSVEAAVPVNPP